MTEPDTRPGYIHLHPPDRIWVDFCDRCGKTSYKTRYSGASLIANHRNNHGYKCGGPITTYTYRREGT